MIMNGRASLRLPSAGLVSLALLAAATLPAWATGTDNDSQQQTQATQRAQATQQTQVAQKTQAEQPKSKPVAKPKPEAKPVSKDVEWVKLDQDVTKVFQQREAHEAMKLFQERGVKGKYLFHVEPETLSDEGQKLVTDYSTDLEAIQKEMQAKLEARREAVIRSLQALQDQYTKAGKLDEAVAIRDYLKAGGPTGNYYWAVYGNKR